MTVNRFKRKEMRQAYQDAIDNYKSGKYGSQEQQIRGSGNRCAFWDGYSGMPNKKYPTNSNSYANFRAGQDAAKGEI